MLVYVHCVQVVVQGQCVVGGQCIRMCQSQMYSLVTLYLTFLEQSLSLHLELTHLAGLTGQHVPGVLLTMSPQHWSYSCMPPHAAFYIDAGDLNLGPHVCVAGILLTEPSPQTL